MQYGLLDSADLVQLKMTADHLDNHSTPCTLLPIYHVVLGQCGPCSLLNAMVFHQKTMNFRDLYIAIYIAIPHTCRVCVMLSEEAQGMEK